MAGDDPKIAGRIILDGAINKLATLSGERETTSVVPNLTVVDANPASLGPDSSKYVLIENEFGFNVPAVKVAGVTYANDDKVNVLYVKGAEPIAFQQGSESQSSGLPLTTKGDLLTRDLNSLERLPVGTDGQVLVADDAADEGIKWESLVGTKGDLITYSTLRSILALGTDGQVLTVDTSFSRGMKWADPVGGDFPFSVWTVDPTEPSADFTTISAAITAASDGDTILVGPGTYDAITVGKILSIIGLDVNKCIISASSGTTVVVSSTVLLKNLNIKNTGTASVPAGIAVSTGGTLTLFNVVVEVTGAASESRALSVVSGNVTAHVSTFASSGATTKRNIFNDGGVIRLYYVHLAAGAVILDTGGGSTAGVYYNGVSTLHVLSSIDLGAGSGELLMDSDGDSTIHSNAGNEIDFKTGGTDRMSLTNSGLALASGARINEFSTDGTLGGASAVAAPTESAVKEYIDTVGGFKAVKNATQSIATGVVTWTTVSWPVEIFDSSGWFASNTYTPTITGRYFITASIELTDFAAAGNLLMIGVLRNGSLVESRYIRANNTLSEVCHITCIIALNASDAITIGVMQNTGGNRNLTADGGRNTFSGYRVTRT